jgi:two-component system, NtrC family, sensor kinase
LGDSYYKLNHFDSANYFFDRGIQTAKINRSEIDLVDLYHGKSRVYKSKNQLDSAIFYARKAMLEPFGKYYPRGVLDAITTLSNLYEIKNQPDSTLKYLRASITLRDSLFNRGSNPPRPNSSNPKKWPPSVNSLPALPMKYKIP